MNLLSLEILLPGRVFASLTGVERLVVDTPQGAMGFLPRRRDCITAIQAGILVYQQQGQAERYVAVDRGILVKTAFQVSLSVRRAAASPQLDELHQLVQQEYLSLNEKEKSARLQFAKIESGLIRRLAEFHHD